MQDPNVPVVCRSCRRTVPMREIKFDENRKAYVCKTCFDSSHKNSFSKIETKSKTQSSPTDAINQKMVKYNCPTCKYHFQRKEDKKITECPYCASKVVNKASESGANRLIDESENWE